ncbi:chemotaxis protein [Burkholderia sp. WAC0059]|uniref:methyl-accepting chemotaxis protein n=1 Tax=Burkholderia sp. WAC0059 TaxID=2066022 RepID=UPI000C7EEB4B|nr:methyl-accepting chemotaxis protein [Burkholderia sp. WAC0059]PLZ04430.1 chemotaxis protein [Burkholderia sp. WAC0059]
MKLSFVQKLWLPLILSLVCLAGLSVYDAYHARDIRLEERKADLQHAGEIALTVVKTFAAQADAGTIPVAEAQRRAMEAVSNIRYGSEGYFTLLNSNVVLMQPNNPAMVGKDVNSFKDPNGVYYFRQSVALIKAHGHGFRTFAFPRPGETVPAPKLAFDIGYQPWDWILTTGVYIDDIDAAFRATLYQNLGILVVLGIVLSGIVVLLNRGVIRSLGGEPTYASSIAQRIAANDFTTTVDVDRNDQSSLLASMKRMQEQLTQVIAGIKTSADSIATASGEISAGNTDLSQRTEEQAASLEETASSMEELTATVRQNADNAKQATTLATAASGVARQGGDVIGRVVETMQGISESSTKVANIITVIESIAFQTNILALNAAVEAARAGEQGRGFAVVATEVRALAQRSASAAKEIKELIGDSVGRVETGSKLVDEAGTTIDEIVRSVARVTDIMNEIAAASLEQSTGIEQVNQAISQMDRVTQQNAALVEQTTAAALSMSAQAQQLREAVAVFHVAETGGAHRLPTTTGHTRSAKSPGAERRAIMAGV